MDSEESRVKDQTSFLNHLNSVKNLAKSFKYIVAHLEEFDPSVLLQLKYPCIKILGFLKHIEKKSQTLVNSVISDESGINRDRLEKASQFDNGQVLLLQNPKQVGELMNEVTLCDTSKNKSIQSLAKKRVYLGNCHQCYVCKDKYNIAHFFYHRLCVSCGDFNYSKRSHISDFSLGKKIAIVTGGRIKIGFEIVVKLLRSDCIVISTTRFPFDALDRFKHLEDFQTLKKNLHIYYLDLCNPSSITKFVNDVKDRFGTIDILINNAAQTIYRPPLFYSRLIRKEQSLQNLGEIDSPIHSHNDFLPTLLCEGDTKLTSTPSVTSKNDCLTNNLQSSISLNSKCYFPDIVDENGIQIDLRPHNTWVTRLQDVNTEELLEVTTINYLSPFLLIQQFYSVLCDNPNDTFVINVSAMEGKFTSEDSLKCNTHPHTNCAKAALNMITRTIAKSWAKDRIFVNSVDTGWVTNEFPVKDSRIIPPLDEIDGAARVLDPVFCHDPNSPVFGKFLKDYFTTDW